MGLCLVRKEKPTTQQRRFWQYPFPRPLTFDISTMRYVVVTGGVVSGLGKGVTASSIGVLLKGCGYRVTHIKIGVYEIL